MSDKDNYDLGDYEYQFPSEEEYAESDAASSTAETETEFDGAAADTSVEQEHSAYVPPQQPAEKSGFLGLLQNKRVLIIVGVLIVAVIGFRFYVKDTNKVEPVKSAQVQQQPVVVQPTRPSQEVLSEINSLKQEITQNNQAIFKLQNQVKQMESQSSSVADSQKALQKTMDDLWGDVNRVDSVLKDLIKKQKQAAKPKVVKKVKPIVFDLRAIVPGRAWIEDDVGRSSTVQVGDKLPQYGMVSRIDPERGMVLTTSGKVITFAPDSN